MKEIRERAKGSVNEGSAQCNAMQRNGTTVNIQCRAMLDVRAHACTHAHKTAPSLLACEHS